MEKLNTEHGVAKSSRQNESVEKCVDVSWIARLIYASNLVTTGIVKDALGLSLNRVFVESNPKTDRVGQAYGVILTNLSTFRVTRYVVRHLGVEIITATNPATPGNVDHA